MQIIIENVLHYVIYGLEDQTQAIVYFSEDNAPVTMSCINPASSLGLYGNTGPFC